MEKTIENMTFILKAVKVKMEQLEFQNAKTLMNTYRTLLGRIESQPVDKDEFGKYVDDLIRNAEGLMILRKKTDDVIQKLIIRNDIREADTVAETGNRLDRAAKSVDSMIRSYNKSINRGNAESETWVVDVSRKKDGNSLVLQLTKINSQTSGAKIIGNLNNPNFSTFRALASLLLEKVQTEKPSRLVFEKAGIGHGLYDSFRSVIEDTHINLLKDGKLTYNN